MKKQEFTLESNKNKEKSGSVHGLRNEMELDGVSNSNGNQLNLQASSFRSTVEKEKTETVTKSNLGEVQRFKESLMSANPKQSNEGEKENEEEEEKREESKSAVVERIKITRQAHSSEIQNQSLRKKEENGSQIEEKEKEESLRHSQEGDQEALPPEIPVHEIIDQIRNENQERKEESEEEDDEDSNGSEPHQIEQGNGASQNQSDVWKGIQGVKLSSNPILFEQGAQERASCTCCSSS